MRLLSTSLNLFLLIGLFTLVERGLCNPSERGQPTYGVTHLEIKSAIEAIGKRINSLDNKLFLHESREKQVADFSTKTLNVVKTDHSRAEKNFQNLARQMGKMEERLMSMENLIKTTDERQRRMISKLSDQVSSISEARLSDSVPPPPPLPLLPHEIAPILGKGAGDENLGAMKDQMNNIEATLHKNMKEINNEVNIVSESLTMFMDLLNERHDRLSSSLSVCNDDVSGNFNKATQNLVNLGESLSRDVATAKSLVKEGGGENCDNCGDMNHEVISRLDGLDKMYKDQEQELKTLFDVSSKAFEEQGAVMKELFKQTKAERNQVNGSFSEVLSNLHDITVDSQRKLETLGDDVRNAIDESTKLLKGDVSSIAKNLRSGTSTIMDAIDDTGSQVENLHRTVGENHDETQKEIAGIAKVEQVMLNTADAVLDTKRSIEFGIQQVILELSDIVKNSGKNINSTLSDQIRNISFDIIKNQTTALTNMTSKVEKEISQVWRQIGVMYQQMTQTVDLLDDLQNTTKTHLNASLSQVGSMDGTVGKISNKVAGVEDNLNYLLGRLSLVVSEFNHMKTGVGEELEKLRDLASDSKLTLFEDGPYKNNRRRHINHHHHSSPSNHARIHTPPHTAPMNKPPYTAPMNTPPHTASYNYYPYSKEILPRRDFTKYHTEEKSGDHRRG